MGEITKHRVLWNGGTRSCRAANSARLTLCPPREPALAAEHWPNTDGDPRDRGQSSSLEAPIPTLRNERWHQKEGRQARRLEISDFVPKTWPITASISPTGSRFGKPSRQTNLPRRPMPSEARQRVDRPPPPPAPPIDHSVGSPHCLIRRRLDGGHQPLEIGVERQILPAELRHVLVSLLAVEQEIPAPLKAAVELEQAEL